MLKWLSVELIAYNFELKYNNKSLRICNIIYIGYKLQACLSGRQVTSYKFSPLFPCLPSVCRGSLSLFPSTCSLLPFTLYFSRISLLYTCYFKYCVMNKSVLTLTLSFRPQNRTIKSAPDYNTTYEYNHRWTRKK